MVSDLGDNEPTSKLETGSRCSTGLHAPLHYDMAETETRLGLERLLYSTVMGVAALGRFGRFAARGSRQAEPKTGGETG